MSTSSLAVEREITEAQRFLERRALGFDIVFRAIQLGSHQFVEAARTYGGESLNPKSQTPNPKETSISKLQESMREWLFEN